MQTSEKKRFVYILENALESLRLEVDETDILTNADGEIDAPLDRVLRKHHMNLQDLFQMNIKNIFFAEEEGGSPKTIRCISLA